MAQRHSVLVFVSYTRSRWKGYFSSCWLPSLPQCSQCCGFYMDFRLTALSWWSWHCYIACSFWELQKPACWNMQKSELGGRMWNTIETWPWALISLSLSSDHFGSLIALWLFLIDWNSCIRMTLQCLWYTFWLRHSCNRHLERDQKVFPTVKLEFWKKSFSETEQWEPRKMGLLLSVLLFGTAYSCSSHLHDW